ncbi:riboflavin synthase subunit alpha [Hahella sp. CCB-MM4]|uniref:riboflavin synthase n=1 Tax=Hahella sp. (strain CCB-MM4) TaxID=1926491 RepID=UPI000B9AB619|nr:riboflavin synthase [Hahella sp. CCB-MM4]OZG71451.1 riboflavin synthase subunit alpha [Hahella sp. CCB-MM4]
MFTGLIETVGSVQHCVAKGGDYSLRIGCERSFMSDVALGDSIAVNGVCLTVTEFGSDWFNADVSLETVLHTCIKEWGRGHRVNLEKALMLSSRLGGHIVTGHVDAVGKVISRKPDGRSIQLTIAAPEQLERYLAAKGSVTVNGVSLTVNNISGCEFALNIVPHTSQETTLDTLKPGDKVHLEVDILARYMEQLMRAPAEDSESDGRESKLNKQFLAHHGFLKP